MQLHPMEPEHHSKLWSCLFHTRHDSFSSNRKSPHLAPGRRKGEHSASPPSLHVWPHRDDSQEVFWNPYPSPPVRQWPGAHRPSSLQSLFLPSSLLLNSGHHPNRHATWYTILENVTQSILLYATACSPWIMRDSGYSWWLNSSYKAWVWVHLHLWMRCGSEMT